MIVTMIVIQVFLMPYIMVANPADVYFSVTQGYMGAAMGSAMVAIDGILWHPMPWWMWAIVIIIGAGAVIGYRKQWLVSDREYLHDMIPHHSMAILTSGPRTKSADIRVARLAEDIILTQERESKQRRFMLEQKA
jgi:hypothetical protein